MILIHETLKAQNYLFNYGVKGGANFSSLRRDPNFERRQYELNMFYHIGTYGDITYRTKNDLLDRMFAIQTEISYSQKGAERNLDGYYFMLKLHCIDVPLMGVVNLIDRYAGNRGVIIKTGVIVNYLLAASEITGQKFNTAPAIGQLKPFGYGWLLCAGVFQEDLMIDGRFELGISDLNNIPGGPMVKHKIWTISVAYRLSRLGRRGNPLKNLKPLKEMR